MELIFCCRMMALAVFCLNVAHPGFGLRQNSKGTFSSVPIQMEEGKMLPGSDASSAEYAPPTRFVPNVAYAPQQ